MAGFSREGGYKGDVILFNVQNSRVSKVAEMTAGETGYYPNTNQSYLVNPEEVVVLCGREGDDKPALIYWKKGDRNIGVIHRFGDPKPESIFKKVDDNQVLVAAGMKALTNTQLDLHNVLFDKMFRLMVKAAGIAMGVPPGGIPTDMIHDQMDQAKS